MSDVLQEIAEIYRRDNPDSVEIYTEEWVRKKCARLNMSPEELLAELNECHAISVAQAGITEDQPWTKDLPEYVKDKLSGPIDGLSYELMKGGKG